MTREIGSLDEPDGRHVIRTWAGSMTDSKAVTATTRTSFSTAGELRQSRTIALTMTQFSSISAISPQFRASSTCTRPCPKHWPHADGPLLLSVGLTTVTATPAEAARLNEQWSGKALPGPRVVAHDWGADFDSGAAAFIGKRTSSRSPAGVSYQDVYFAGGTATSTWLTGLADGNTPALNRIWESRQAQEISTPVAIASRFTETPDLSAVVSSLVLASKPNGLPPGIGMHAELRALVAAGLSEEQALRTAGVNAANALGFGYRLGRIAPGSAAPTS